MPPRRNELAIYKESLSRFRFAIETSGRDFFMHDTGIVVTLLALAEHITKTGESDEIDLGVLIDAWDQREIFHLPPNGGRTFGADSGCQAFIVIKHDVLGIWPKDEEASEMRDVCGISLQNIRLACAIPNERRWR